MTTFREAVEARDLSALAEVFADDVVFRSPAVFKPYTGKPIVVAILGEVMRVFEDFRYVRELGSGVDHALVFEATVDGLEITGCDFLRADEHGLITELMVMTRPLKATQALATRMAERFARLQAGS